MYSIFSPNGPNTPSHNEYSIISNECSLFPSMYNRLQPPFICCIVYTRPCPPLSLSRTHTRTTYTLSTQHTHTNMAASVSPLRSSFRICSPLTLPHHCCRAKLRMHRKCESQRRHLHQTATR